MTDELLNYALSIGIVDLDGVLEVIEYYKDDEIIRIEHLKKEKENIKLFYDKLKTLTRLKKE